MGNIEKITRTLGKGYTSKASGVHVCAASATAALAFTIEAEKVLIIAPIANTDTVWIGATSTISSATGYGLLSGSVISLEISGSSSGLYFQSEGGSSTISYLALGFVN